MAKPLTAKCDQCSEDFTPQIKEKPTSDGGAERFFYCPHCRHRYAVARISPAGVQLMSEIRRVELTLQRQPRNGELQEQLVELRQRLQPEVTKS